VKVSFQSCRIYYLRHFCVDLAFCLCKETQKDICVSCPRVSQCYLLSLQLVTRDIYIYIYMCVAKASHLQFDSVLRCSSHARLIEAFYFELPHYLFETPISFALFWKSPPVKLSQFLWLARSSGPERIMYTVYRIFGDSLAKNTVNTLYIHTYMVLANPAHSEP